MHMFFLETFKFFLNDITNRGISEIYSLDDNIGVSLNPIEVIDLFQEYDVKLIAGNSEDYFNLVFELFFLFYF